MQGSWRNSDSFANFQKIIDLYSHCVDSLIFFGLFNELFLVIKRVSDAAC